MRVREGVILQARLWMNNSVIFFFFNETSKKKYFVCLEYSGGGHSFTKDNSLGGLTRITADRNIFERQFWEMFLQPPLADLTLTFEDGDLTVNRAVLAALSGEEML